jgi:iron complex transport system permease protein
MVGSSTSMDARYRDMNIVGTAITLDQAIALHETEQRVYRHRYMVLVVVIALCAFLSLSLTGAEHAYRFYSPVVVAQVLGMHVHDIFASLSGLYAPYSSEYLARVLPEYGYCYEWIWERAGVVLITLICGVLLSLSGMLYQNTFRNPLAGPSMLGVSSGVSLGITVLVLLYGTAATAMTTQRYLLCYSMGAAVLIFVIGAGKALSGKGRLDLVHMLLIGAIISQVVGALVTFITLWVMDEDLWTVYYSVSQVLTVDSGLYTWIALGIAMMASILPVYLLRFRLNGLAFDDAEIRLMGLSPTLLRGTALLCGAIMILAAQIHTGMVAMISLVVPFITRSMFGCEFRKQFAGNLLMGMLVLLVCRDIVDAIPFVGDGLAIGTVASLVVLPLVIWMMARDRRPWD